MITHAKSRFTSRPSAPPSSRLLVGIVHGPGGVEHVAVAASRRALMEELARWAVVQGRDKLSRAESDQVAQLAGEGRYVPAIRRYLALVGHRWDPESLFIERVEVAGMRSARRDP